MNLTNGAELDLRRVEVDADENPVSFLVEGDIHGVDDGVLVQMSGNTITPVAVRFEVTPA